MDDQQKSELIQAINEIRKELNLQPYSSEHLEAKGVDELRRLYSSYFQMREDYRKRLEREKSKFKFSSKFLPLILIPAIAVVGFFLLTQNSSKTPGEITESVYATPIPTIGQPILPQNFSTKLLLIDDSKTNLTFKLVNYEVYNINSFDVFVAGDKLNYSIAYDVLPLLPNQSLTFVINTTCPRYQLENITIRYLGKYIAYNLLPPCFTFIE